MPTRWKLWKQRPVLTGKVVRTHNWSRLNCLILLKKRSGNYPLVNARPFSFVTGRNWTWLKPLP